MIKVLQIIDGKSFGGIYKLFIDIGNSISHDIELNYLSATKVYECNNSYDLDIDRSSIKGRIIYNYRLYKFLKEHKYDIAHINSGAFFFTFFCVITCKLSGIKRIVVHSHNTPNAKVYKRILIKILNPLYRKLTNVHLSCSKNAIKSLFTKDDDVIIIKNGIDTNKYKFNKSLRKKYRNELNINNKIVYGHIGRFDKQKNHDFLIDIFYELQKEQDAVLLLIGNGKLEKEIKEKVKKLNIEDKVLFLGFRSDVNKLLNAIDILLFPSLYEGFGNVVIEAQTSGIPVFVSSGVPYEGNISSNYHKIITFNADDWKKEIMNIKIDTDSRVNAYKNTIKYGYDIRDTSKELEKIYKDLMK